MIRYRFRYSLMYKISDQSRVIHKQEEVFRVINPVMSVVMHKYMGMKIMHEHLWWL